MRIRSSKVGAALVALTLLLSALMTGSASANTKFEGRELIYRKHVDAVHIVWTGSGLDIKVREGENTIRDANDVAIRLGPDADQDGYEVSRFRVPDDKDYAFMGKPGDIVWLAPQQLYQGWPPVWAGIGHGELPETVKDLRLTLVDDGGPGKVELYRTIGLAGKPERELSSTDEALRTYEPGSHGHYSWIFTKPGVYRMKWKATATLASGTKVESPEVTVPWLVGSDEQVGLPEGTTKGAPIKYPVDGAAAGEPEPTPDVPSPGAPSPEPPTANPPSEHPFARNSTKELPNCTPISNGHLDISTVLKEDGGLWMRSRLDTASGKQTLPWNGAVLEVPNSARQQIPDGASAADLRAALGTAVAWELPESQNKALPWPGFSTEELDYANIEKLTYQVESWEGPDGSAWAIGGFNPARGKFVVQVDSANNASQAIELPQGSHMHTGWYFSKPGFYTLTLKAEATPKDASKMKSWQRVTTLPVTFAVSDDAVAFTCDRNGEGLESPGGDNPTPADPARPDDGAKPEAPDRGEVPSEEPAEGSSPSEEPGAGEAPSEDAVPGLPSTGV
ncbi:choice-of-anchor M domain-containing protein [uncultured Tessaracoccus sp.]|uniref:choice-of-anchor M domain-containing protein n=1 Tax=uncultured Tessaracoccus sp. TaxID=905023 RepID=UPI00262BC0B9|nr:choice-of-anchor M domain-containing protein [uncultured Tessaracoccus sp.]